MWANSQLWSAYEAAFRQHQLWHIEGETTYTQHQQHQEALVNRTANGYVARTVSVRCCERSLFSCISSVFLPFLAHENSGQHWLLFLEHQSLRFRLDRHLSNAQDSEHSRNHDIFHPQFPEVRRACLAQRRHRF